MSDGKKKGKKILRWIGIIAGSMAALLGIAILITMIWFNEIVKTGVSEIGPLVTGGPVSLERASFNIFTTRLKFNGIKVGNPKEYKSPNAITVKRIVFEMDPWSLFTDKIRIRELTVDGVDLYYEQGLTTNNLNDINRNIQAFQKKNSSGEAKPEPEEKEQKPVKLQVDKLRLVGIYVNTVFTIPGTKPVNAPIPVLAISQDNLGQGPDGISGVDLLNTTMNSLTLGAFSALGDALGAGFNAVSDGLKTSVKGIGDAAESLTNKFKSGLGIK